MVDNNWEDDDIYLEETEDVSLDEGLEEDFDSDEMEDNEPSIDDDEEYSQDQYEEDEYDYGDYYDEEGAIKSKKNALLLIIVIILLIGVIAVVALITVPKMLNPVGFKKTVLETKQEPKKPNLETASTTEEVAEAFFNEAGGKAEDMMSINFGADGEANVLSGAGDSTDDVATVKTAPISAEDGELVEESNDSSLVIVSYNSSTRLNPFKPFEDLVLHTVPTGAIPQDESLGSIPFEVIEPPTKSVEDSNITRLLSAQISGILYDEESPSAIVNISGQDHFVKVGDSVSGYEIQGITKNKVQIAYKNNTYIASVGELFIRGSLDGSAIDNFENKFAGRRLGN